MVASSFTSALHANGPAPDCADKTGLYGWLIGAWEFDAVVYDDEGGRHEARGSIHFGWVLEGRAIQDVWVLPGFFHGTTLRVYDPGFDAWHILWSDPLKQYYTRQIGRARQRYRARGHERGRRENSLELYRNHTRLVPLARGERSRDGGATWHLQADFRARCIRV